MDNTTNTFMKHTPTFILIIPETHVYDTRLITVPFDLCVVLYPTMVKQYELLAM